MSENTKILKQFKKANKLVRLAFRKNGPKSFKRGQGALLNALLDGAKTQRELVPILGVNRAELKSVAKKAQRNGYVTLEGTDEKRTYKVALTEAGKALAEKRDQANDKTAAQILSCLNDEEKEQLAAISEKLIVAMKDAGISGKKKGYKVFDR